MKGMLLILFITGYYYLAEVSARPDFQVTESSQDILDGVRNRMKEVWNQAQNKTSEIFNRAIDFFQNTFGSSQLQQFVGRNDSSKEADENLMEYLEPIKK